MKYTTFEEMPVWQKAMHLAQKVHTVTKKLPSEETFSLISQIRRSGLSVPGNISEGFGRKHTKDKLNFYYDARGSLCETKNHLIYGKRVGYFTTEEFRELDLLIEDIWRELNNLIAGFRISLPQP